MVELPNPQNRPMVPEPLPNPESLGGIRKEESPEDDSSSLELLGDRAADTKEDLDEKLDWENRLAEAEQAGKSIGSSDQIIEDENLLKE